MSYRDEVKDAARGRWLELLIEVGGIHRDLLDGKHHHCPRCGGRDRFRLIDEEDGAVLCNQCFSEKNGDGLAAIQWMLGCSFSQALDMVAGRVGVKRKTQKRKEKTPDDVLKFEEWRSDRASWCEQKGIEQTTCRAEGAQMAEWRSRRVITFPIYGTKIGEPRGYAIVDALGRMLPCKAGEAKILVAQGSKTGWIGKRALERLENARIVWKVEGVTDQLALSQAIEANGINGSPHVAITNPFGSTEKPKPHLLEIFKGKLVGVVHDPDDAGLKGATRWAEAIANVAEEVRIVQLPDGADLRDWLAAGHSLDDLRDLVSAAAPIAGRKSGPDEPDSPTDVEVVTEEDDDHVRLARLFIRRKARRFVIHHGAPHFWRDHRWVCSSTLDDLRGEVLRFVIQEFDRMAREEAEMSAKKDDDPPKRQRINAQVLGSILTMVRSLATIPSEITYGSMLERDEEGEVIGATKRNLISFTNCLIDIDTLLQGGKDPIDHTPDWWSLASLPFAFDPDAKIGPYWSAFLKKNLAGDEKLILCLQQWLGYCLVPNTEHHRFLMMIGEGANGKSVFCAVLEALLGEQNVSHVPLELFGNRFALASTLGKLANIATETSTLDKASEGFLKQFTDGSMMHFDRKGLPAIEARPTAKLVLATNRPPRFADKSMGLWRRMLIAPFQVTIGASEKILGLDRPDWWLERGELPGIFMWALEGLRRLQEDRDFATPASAEAAKETLRRDNSPAREFILENLRFQEDSYVPRATVYKAYRAFCEANGNKPTSSRMFERELLGTIQGAKVGRRGGRSDQTWSFVNVVDLGPPGSLTTYEGEP